MRSRFEIQYQIGQPTIENTPFLKRSRDEQDALVRALLYIYITPEWNEKVFSILENEIIKTKKYTGRKGMNLWQIFVLAQFRLCLNANYDRLHTIVNNDRQMRQLMGIEEAFGQPHKEISYQNLIDNLNLLDNQMIIDINKVIVELGMSIFKKKEMEALQLKTDTFVVKSNVHFPTDYNLLWDCARKSIDTITYIIEKNPTFAGWRKIKEWHNDLKSLMRSLGKSSSSGGKDKEKHLKHAVQKYLNKASALSEKLHNSLKYIPTKDLSDVLQKENLEKYLTLLDKHIDLVERRLIKGETIPHEEKMFSIFETYTEWITKGKLHPNVELGKNLAITTNQYGIIMDYYILNKETDSEIVPIIKERIASEYSILSWSFDKGFWSRINKDILSKSVQELIMPKKGKRNQQEEAEETSKSFKKLRNKHSAVESNINELEHRGLNRCPDKGFNNFQKYVGLSISAYNLHKIGRKLKELEIEKIAA